jgi:cyclic beta-1,2-glucan synthetase
MNLSNHDYRVTLNDDGGSFSEVLSKGFDLTRRSYDVLDPVGRAFFLTDVAEPAESPSRSWPIFGNFPQDRFPTIHVKRNEGSLRVDGVAQGIRSTLEITLPDPNATAEIWTVTLENRGDSPRQIKAVPYVEWVLDRPESDRGHSQYVRLFPEMEYVSSIHGLVAWQRKTNTVGFLATDMAPEGFHSSRIDFIGRARSLWTPRLLETLDFLGARDTSGYPTFDPIGALCTGVTLGGHEKRTLRYILGFSADREKALEMAQRFLVPTGSAVPGGQQKKKVPLIGHGEILPGTPQPYATFLNGGDTLRVHTPFTPRPFDHALSNSVGHYVMVTNRGLQTTSNGNSQQNPITPDWADTVTRELPSEAIYLYDTEERDWYSPTHHPLNDARATLDCDFGVDGTAVFRMRRGTLSTELTVFVPPQESLGVYLLTIRNHGGRVRRLRVSPYFQMALAPLGNLRPADLIHTVEEADHALLFENPANTYRPGPAFAAVSFVPDLVETQRGRFLGSGRGSAHPYLVENGIPDDSPRTEDRVVASFLGNVEIEPGAEKTVVVVLGQTDTKDQALALIRKYKDIAVARKSLEETRGWWKGLMSTLRVKTNQGDFDGYQNWLKYQALAERIWARRGFYQTSGAYGFRDQLQDTVNLIWVDPALARRQIILHASQQFTEGDVLHWFHTNHKGETAFSNRTHASDNPLWLVWGVVEYLRMTGDVSLLDEMTTYLQGEKPFLPLPHNKQGCGGFYPRSSIADTVYKHSLKSIDLVLDKRMGVRGLPLIGTGDWNDGLDEIGSEGRGESVWLGFFLHYTLKYMLPFMEERETPDRKEHYRQALLSLEKALEQTWRGDRYLRAIHDDGTEIGVKDSGVWEIDALTAAWAVYAGINPTRARTVFHTALSVLEKENVILLGWPPLRSDTKPYLGRSSQYPAGVRENGMYCHGVQWLIRAARLLAEQAETNKEHDQAKDYRSIAYRLWLKITPVSHVVPGEIEVYGGQPNKQSADMVTTFDPGRMIWNGYTGAAAWLLRQSMEGVIGATLIGNKMVLPGDIRESRGALIVESVKRDLSQSPLV